MLGGFHRGCKGALVALLLLVVAAPAVQAQTEVPGNIGNTDDGVVVDVADLQEAQTVDRGWLPTVDEALIADCEATADQPQLVEQNGLVLIRATAHWDCNVELPSNYIQACLDLGFPSVNCNEKYRAAPRDHLAVKVDFPCVPGVWIAMAAGSNIFDTNPANNEDHNAFALIVEPLDCEYVKKLGPGRHLAS